MSAPISGSTPRERTYRTIFEHDTPAGRTFDVALIVTIVVSVIVVMLESVASLRLEHGPLLRALE